MYYKYINPEKLIELGFEVTEYLGRNSSFVIPGTRYYCILFLDNESMYWYDNVNGIISFEKVLDNCPESFKDVLLFNLDLFT